MEWQAVAALQDGEMIAERPNATPNPAVEVRESLPDGTDFKAVWSHLRQSDVTKLVTVHFSTEVSHAYSRRANQTDSTNPE